VTNASNLTVALNWIDGAWVGAEQVRESINPASYEVIGAYADGGLEAARVAIAAAKRAFQPCCANSTRSWSKCLHGSRCPPAASSFWAGPANQPKLLDPASADWERGRTVKCPAIGLSWPDMSLFYT
jgi:hypothetical protein